MTLLLVIIALLGGFAFGICCTTLAIEKYYPTAWKILLLEVNVIKRKRAEAARDKAARP